MSTERTNIVKRLPLLVAALLASVAAVRAVPPPAPWQAGVAQVVITPREPMRLAGFAFRTHASEGVRQDIYARVLALRDESGRTAALVTLDLTSLDREMAEEVAAQCQRRYGLARDRIVLNISHTHSAPVAGLQWMPMYVFDAAERDAVRRYTGRLIEQVVATVATAIERLEPATLTFHQGLAGIAVNRRRVAKRSLPGPVDHDVPVLAVRNARGALIAIVAGYACHATALNDYLIGGDWPGYAREAIEKSHPGAMALFVQGCGADANALPRQGEELARMHGEVLAAAAGQALTGKALPLSGSLRTAFGRVDLPIVNPVAREELRRRAADRRAEVRGPAEYLLAVLDREGRLPDHCAYPVQIWKFGDALTFLALGGEVVVDYSLRFKRQYGFDSTWVAGYSNDIPAYIPSLRVLREGGYEGGDAMLYFGRPGVFGEAVEEIIAGEVAALIAAAR
jgi:hypothetical protein